MWTNLHDMILYAIFNLTDSFLPLTMFTVYPLSVRHVPLTRLVRMEKCLTLQSLHSSKRGEQWKTDQEVLDKLSDCDKFSKET